MRRRSGNQSYEPGPEGAMPTTQGRRPLPMNGDEPHPDSSGCGSRWRKSD
ncbi:MAG TPA: hypothetical protein VI357_25870 [Mycobacteriales bacterium]